jgi:hypothetical protein
MAETVFKMLSRLLRLVDRARHKEFGWYVRGPPDYASSWPNVLYL